MTRTQSGVISASAAKLIRSTAPKISVITVCFNTVQTIKQTLGSVAEQAGVDLEHIVIDGGSTDGTIAILRLMEDSLTYWVSEADGGIYDAMNKGLQHAQGEWVLFLNADDYLASPTSLASLLAAVTPDVAILSGGTLIKYKDFERPFRSSRYFGLLLQLPFMHPSTIVRRSAFETCGHFDTRYKLAADCDFLLRMFSRGHKYRYINEVVTVMRVGGASQRGFIRGRIEYMQAYWRNMRDPLGACLGFAVSVALHLKAKLRLASTRVQSTQTK